MFDANKIWSSTTLPTLPSVAVKLLELSRDPETELADIVQLIRTDPAICAKILQSTNSSFFGFSSQVTSIDRAVTLLGTTGVTSLALSFSLASDSVHSGPLQDHYRSYWKQSIIHAVAAETIGKTCSKGLECEFFLAGLMMDIGRLAMLKTVSRDYYPAIVTAQSQQKELHVVEKEFLGLDHAEVSCQLMDRWRLPVTLINGVRYQHASDQVLRAHLQPGTHMLEAAMVLANAVGDYFMSPVCGMALKRILWLAEYYFQMTESDVEKYLATLRDRIDQAGDLFSIDMSDIGDPSDLMAQANQQLLELTIRTHAENAQITARQKQIEQEKKQLQSQNLELQEKVTRDPLTGVFNRAYFDNALEAEIQEAQDRCQPISVIFADIDKFKTLNDTYGHACGDEVLKRFAHVVSKNLRSSDILARYGGEEFVILVSRPTEKGVEKLTERIRSAVEGEPFEVQGTRISVTASFGTSIAIPGRRAHNCAESILHQADAAMYDSKRGGRNQVHLRCLFTEEERQLLKAINQAKFSRWLVNQEILDIPAISRALLQVTADTRPFGALAHELNLMTDEEINTLMLMQEAQTEYRFGDLAVVQKIITMSEMEYILAWQTEPPQKLRKALVTNGLFSEERSLQLYEQYFQSTAVTHSLAYQEF